MMATQQNARKNEGKQPKGKLARTSPPKSAPAAELPADSDLSGSECPSPEQQRMSDKAGTVIDLQWSEFFEKVADMPQPLSDSMVDVVVDGLSEMQRQLTASEVEQLSNAFNVKTPEDLREFVSNRFRADCRLLELIGSEITQSSDDGRCIGKKWMRHEQRMPNEKAVKEADEHYKAKLSRWTKDFEQALKNTQTEKMRRNTLTGVCAPFGMPPDSLDWLAASGTWYTQNPNDLTNPFWQQLEAAKKTMHAKIQDALCCVIRVREQQSTPGERQKVLLQLSQTIGYQKNMLSAFASDTNWSNIKTGGEVCEFKLAYDNLLAQCEKKQEQAREDFHKAMLRRDEIVQMRLRALSHLASAATKYSSKTALDDLAYTDTFDTYDPDDASDVFTRVLEDLRVYGESTVGSFFIGK